MEVKRVATFSVILVKLATPPLPPQTKLNFEQMGGMTAFLATNFLGGGRGGGGVGDVGMYPKEIKKIVIRSRVLCNNYLEGLFHTVQSSLIFVPHCRCPFNRGSKYKDYMNIFSGTRFCAP